MKQPIAPTTRPAMLAGWKRLAVMSRTRRGPLCSTSPFLHILLNTMITRPTNTISSSGAGVGVPGGKVDSIVTDSSPTLLIVYEPSSSHHSERCVSLATTYRSINAGRHQSKIIPALSTGAVDTSSKCGAYEYLIQVHAVMARHARQKTSCIQGKRRKTGVGACSVTRPVSPDVLGVSGSQSRAAPRNPQ